MTKTKLGLYSPSFLKAGIRSFIMVAAVVVSGFISGPAQAEWLNGKTAQLQTLDKITARISTLDVEVGKASRFGSLQIIVHSCQFRPPTIAPEHSGLIEIRTIDHNDIVSEDPIFQGWMFASSPALNALEHPVYDVSVLACKKD